MSRLGLWMVTLLVYSILWDTSYGLSFGVMAQGDLVL